MYVTVPYNNVLFSILYILTSQSEVDFGIALVVLYGCEMCPFDLKEYKLQVCQNKVHM